MNRAIIRYILGIVLKIEGVLMLLPCIVALIYQEVQGIYYIIIAVLAFLLGLLLTKKEA